MRILLLNFLILLVCCTSAKAAQETPTAGKVARKGSSTNHPTRTNTDGPTREALRMIESDRQAGITPILAQKHAAIRKIMDNKTLSTNEKKESIRLALAEYDERVSIIFAQTSAKIDDILASSAAKSKGPRN